MHIPIIYRYPSNPLPGPWSQVGICELFFEKPIVWCEWRAVVFLPYFDKLVYNSLKKNVHHNYHLPPMPFVLFRSWITVFLLLPS